MRKDIAALRQEYTQSELDEDSVLKNPFDQFEKWFEESIKSGIKEPNAMVLSTSTAYGSPSSRTVLLKSLEKTGLVFYSNYESKKGTELSENPVACVLFPWYELERQVIITGKVQRVSREISYDYFRSRPRSSQLGAHVSNQSKKIRNRDILEEKMKVLKAKYADKEIPLPNNWGGYVLLPHTFEFWQGRPSRLHDRILFEKEADKWNISRLSP